MRHVAARSLIAAACIVATACSGGAQDGPGATSASAPSPAADPAPPAPTAPSSAGSATAPAGGGPKLAASDAPVTEREAAALKILRGEADAKQAAVEATDNGAPLDPTLRDRIAPRAQPPRVKMGATTVNGELPPEVIQRIVRQSFGRFRLCYENALKNEPTIEGKIDVKFTIDKDGSTSKVREGTSTIKDAGMRSCVTKAFQGLSFPQPPEGGIVTVVYPILFEPPIE